MAQNDNSKALYHRSLDNGYEITVWPTTFGKARVCIGPDDLPTYDRGYCYQDMGLAILAAIEWTGIGDPRDGWHREVSTGRRREGGDPLNETVNWSPCEVC